MPENRPTGDSIEVYARNQVDEELLRLITRRIRLADFEQKGAKGLLPGVKASIATTMSEIGGYALIGGLSEEEVRRKALASIGKVLGNFAQGYYNTGAVYGAIRKEDQPTIKELEREIAGGRFSFITEETVSRSTEFRRRTEDELHAIKEKANQVNQFCIGFSQRKWLDFGTEAEVTEFRDDLDPSGGVPLSVPLIAGRALQIQVSEWDKKYFPQDMQQDQTGIYSDHSYLPYNALFYYQPNPQPGRRVIRPLTPFQLVLVDSGMGRRIGSKNLVEEGAGLRLGALFFDQGTMALMQKILKRELGFDWRSVRRMTSEQIIKRVTDFVGDNASGADIIDGEERLETLLAEYQAEGTFPGTCKSLATLVAGFYEAMGLPSRLVGGMVFLKDTGKQIPHAWAEAFMPEVASWALMDASLNHRFLYPARGDVYFMENIIYPSHAPLKITVDLAK